jgi:hypothetical protein
MDVALWLPMTLILTIGLLNRQVGADGCGQNENRPLRSSASMIYRVRRQLVEEGFEAPGKISDRPIPA